VNLDPLFTLYHLIMAQYCIGHGEYERGADHARQILEIDPRYAFAYCVLGESYSRAGRHEEAIGAYEKGMREVPGEYYPMGYLTWAYVAAGRRDDAERFLAGLEEQRRRRYVPAGTLAYATLGLGDMDGAWKWIEQAVEDRDPNLIFAIAELDFAPLRADPRYQSLMRQMNLS
jgi:Flp pilus assembly protein TadD